MSDCPSCNSRNTKKMQMVWAAGTRTSQRQSTGVGVSSRGTVGVGVGRGQTFSQSHLAAACAPPKRSKTPMVVTIILLLAFWAPMLGNVSKGLSDGRYMTVFFGSLLLALMSFGLYKLYSYLDRSNKANEEAYSRMWVCLKCGNTFE